MGHRPDPIGDHYGGPRRQGSARDPDPFGTYAGDGGPPGGSAGDDGPDLAAASRLLRPLVVHARRDPGGAPDRRGRGTNRRTRPDSRHLTLPGCRDHRCRRTVPRRHRRGSAPSTPGFRRDR